MLDYTKAAIKKTVADLKTIDYIRNVVTQGIYIAYLIYALVTKSGNFWVNLTLALLSSAYFTFFLIVTEVGKSPDGKKELRKTVKTVFTWCKRLLKLYTLGVMTYGLYLSTGNVNPISVIFSAFMIVGFILQIIFEVLVRIVANRLQFLIEGLEADFNELTKPVKTVGNFFKKLTGKEVEPEKPTTKNKELLQKLVAEEKARKVDEKKRRKAEIKAKKDAEKRMKRKSKKAAPPALPELTEELAPTDALTTTKKD